MFKITRKETTWGGRKLVLESGHVARQADGAVLATLGETVVLPPPWPPGASSPARTSSR